MYLNFQPDVYLKPRPDVHLHSSVDVHLDVYLAPARLRPNPAPGRLLFSRRGSALEVIRNAVMVAIPLPNSCQYRAGQDAGDTLGDRKRGQSPPPALADLVRSQPRL